MSFIREVFLSRRLLQAGAHEPLLAGRRARCIRGETRGFGWVHVPRPLTSDELIGAVCPRCCLPSLRHAVGDGLRVIRRRDNDFGARRWRSVVVLPAASGEFESFMADACWRMPKCWPRSCTAQAATPKNNADTIQYNSCHEHHAALKTRTVMNE